jgi:hypothetical protein
MHRSAVPLSAEAAAALRAEPGTTLALDLTSAARRLFGRDDATFYRLADGRVLCDIPWMPVILPSEEGLLDRWSGSPANESPPWAERRGVATWSTNYGATLVRAPIADVTARLLPIAAGHVPDALERDVPAARSALIVFQLGGHAWTIVLTDRLGHPYERVGEVLRAASRERSWTQLEVAFSDTAGTQSYTLLESGAVVERLEAESDAITLFESDRRTLDQDDESDPYGVIDTLVTALDAYIPDDLSSDRFLPERDRATETWRLVRPQETPPPTFERVSYFWFDAATS